MSECVRVCVRVRARMCVRACVYVCVCVCLCRVALEYSLFCHNPRSAAEGIIAN